MVQPEAVGKACPECGAEIEAIIAWGRGQRPGQRVARASQRVVAGWRCTDPGCRYARGFPMGVRPADSGV